MTKTDASEVTAKARILSREEIAQIEAADTLLQAENSLVRAYTELSSAESDLHEKGMAFGRAMIAFRHEYKRKGKGWLARIPELGISEAKAYYWIHEVEGKPTNRHHRYWNDQASCVTQKSGSGGPRKPLDWAQAQVKLNNLIDTLTALGAVSPESKAALLEPVERLAGLIGYTLVPTTAEVDAVKGSHALSIN